MDITRGHISNNWEKLEMKLGKEKKKKKKTGKKKKKKKKNARN